MIERCLSMREFGPRTTPHCCEDMTSQVARDCDTCEDRYACPDCLIHHASAFDEYGLLIKDGGASYILLRHCPWCGADLPESRREECFERLEELGFDDPCEEDVPEEFRDDRWIRGKAGS